MARTGGPAGRAARRGLRAVALASALLALVPNADSFCLTPASQHCARLGAATTTRRPRGGRWGPMGLRAVLSRDAEAEAAEGMRAPTHTPTPEMHDFDEEGAKFRRLCGWMREGGGWVGPVSVATTPWGGRDLVATRDVREGEVILYLPRHLQLYYEYHDGGEGADFVRSAGGMASPGLLKVIEKIPQGIWAMQLAMVLCREVLLHREGGSKFGPYLDALPGSYGGLPMNLHREDVKILQVPRMVQSARLRQDFVDFFKETVLDSLPGTREDPFLGHKLDRDLIMWALATAGTRAFRARKSDPSILSEPSRGGHLASLFPLIDMINHDNNPSVEIWENRENDRSGGGDRLEYGIKATRDVKAGEALRLSYGDDLDNQQLMLDYGFVLPENEHASVEVPMEHMHYALRSAVEHFPELFDDEMQSTRAERDQMRKDKNMKLDFIQSASNGAETVLTINSDGSFDNRSWAVARVFSAESLDEVQALGDPFSQGTERNEGKAKAVLQRVCQQELDNLPTSLEEDEDLLVKLEAEPEAETRRGQEQQDSKKAAVRFRMDHKNVLHKGLEQIEKELSEQMSEEADE